MFSIIITRFIWNRNTMPKASTDSDTCRNDSKTNRENRENHSRNNPVQQQAIKKGGLLLVAAVHKIEMLCMFFFKDLQ